MCVVNSITLSPFVSLSLSLFLQKIEEELQEHDEPVAVSVPSISITSPDVLVKQVRPVTKLVEQDDLTSGSSSVSTVVSCKDEEDTSLSYDITGQDPPVASLVEAITLSDNSITSTAPLTTVVSSTPVVVSQSPVATSCLTTNITSVIPSSLESVASVTSSPPVPAPVELTTVTPAVSALPSTTPVTSPAAVSIDTLAVATSPRPSPSPLSLTPDITEDTPSHLTLSQRVLVANSVQGIIRYIGNTEFANGLWVGIELDEARGKNDGSVNGRRYFTCPPKHGVFAPPSKIASVDEESSERESSISEDFSSEREEERESVNAVSPEPLLDNLLQEATNAVQPEEDSLTSVSQLSNDEQPRDLDDTLVQEEEEVEGTSPENVQELSNETVAQVWRKRRGDGKEKESSIDAVTDQLLSALLQSEVDLICNIRDTKEAMKQEEEEEEVVRKNDHIPVQSVTTAEVKIKKVVNKERGISFSSEPLALVPSSRQLVNRIVQCAWNALKDHTSSQLAVPTQDHTPIHLVPSQELINELCNKTGVMLNCEKSFVHLVFNLALRVMEGERTGSIVSHRISCSTLEHVQDRVYTLLHQGKRPHPLPPLRYLHNNRRPGGKEVDFIDSLLLGELRHEEPSWVNYRLEEDKIKKRTADDILDFLLDETVEVIKDIYLRKK